MKRHINIETISRTLWFLFSLRNLCFFGLCAHEKPPRLPRPNSTKYIFESKIHHTKRSLSDTQSLEREVLVALFQATSGSEWTINENWVTTDEGESTVCDWFGITCTALGNIEKIQLSSNNLRGSVPLHALLRFPYLQVLTLDGNPLTFSNGPPLLSEDPVDKSSIDIDVWEGIIFDDQKSTNNSVDTGALVISSLRYIDLSHTDALGGSFSNLFQMAWLVKPDESQDISTETAARYIHFPLLNDLYLAGCQLHGSFPDRIELNLFGSMLERWVLDDNGLSGTLNSDFSSIMGNLHVFKASGNNLSGEIPNGLGKLHKLRHLGLRGNKFYGTIPSGLRCDGSGTDEGANLLEILDLGRQRGASSSIPTVVGLTGNLPSFSKCENLRRLDLSHNQIGGTIPMDFLKGVDPLIFEGAYLNSNIIGGMLPGEPLVRFDPELISIQDNHITSLDDLLLCESSRSGAISAFGCSAVLCPPGFYFPATGKQEEVDEECKSCGDEHDSKHVYWGAISCDLTEQTILSTQPPNKPYLNNEEFELVESQKAILKEIFESTGGENWRNNYGWNSHETVSFCEWYGVTCAPDVNAIESLDLQSNNLHGHVPTSVFHLPFLKSFTLKDNNIFSSFSSDFFKDIGQSSSLEFLDLSSTGLSDISGIENARSTLTELHLDSNPFDGASIPDQIFSLENLMILTLDSCNFSGNIDYSIYLLNNLVLLSASDNKLEGEIPPEISYLNSLSTLRLQNNLLSGTIPSALNLLQSLTALDLSGQKHENRLGLGGSLIDFAGLPYLTRLDLSHNSLTGSVPSSFLATVDPSTFEFVDLSDNLLVSSFPINLSPILWKVHLQQNEISSVKEICDMALNEGESKTMGCDAILCAPGSFNALGRAQSMDDPCVACHVDGGAQYYGSVECREKKRLSPKDAVKLIYSSCNGSNWLFRSNWMSENISECQWEGITCSETSEIIEISLRSNGLSGTFPSKSILEALPSLTSLALEGNDVSFSFGGIKSASSLTKIDLTNTNTESLDGINVLTSLTEVYASASDLIGSFPKDLLSLDALERLDLSFNGLTGSLPVELGSSFRNLQLLAMHNNFFSGTLPISFGEMNSLHFLQLQSNQLTGKIPEEMSGLTGLIKLDLSDQTSLGGGLTGTLPSFSELRDLSSLDLSGNKLQSSVPSNFLEMANILTFERLDVSSNFLKGELPGSLSRFPSSKIDFSDNQISGVADDLCGNNCAMVLCAPTTYSESGKQNSESDYCDHCPHALYWGTTYCPGLSPTQHPTSKSNSIEADKSESDILRLIYDLCGGDNWFHKNNWISVESICNWYGITCDTSTGAVQAIVLSGNNLNGLFPPAIFFLQHLETLVLDSNELRFDFSSIKYAINLASIDLSNTGIFELDGISNAPKLSSLDISRNNFKGSIPLELFQIATLQQLFIGTNVFDSSIPSAIGDLKGLKVFSCSSSHLSGSIPASIGELTELVHLNLADNALTGRLPSELELLENLAYLDISRQKLNGELMSFKSLRNIRRIDLSENAFTGTIPLDFLTDVNPLFFDYLDLSSNFLSGTVPAILNHFDTIFLQDNQFSAIDSELCDKSRGSIFEQFGCNATLCPPGTYNLIGRQDSEANECKICLGSLYYGAISCDTAPDNVGTTDLLPSNVIQETQALTKFYLVCGGDYWSDNTNWMNKSIIHCHWNGVECYNETKSVKALNLGANNIVGTPPKELFQDLPNLNKITLNSNLLSSFNFYWLEDAQKLQDLDLDATRLVSIDGIGASTSLRHISLRNNHLSGPFPDELFKVKTLESLIISHNNLDGPIPMSFDKLPYLETLLLNNNRLKGHLNDTSFPPTIKVLDLSHNLLSGEVPSTFLENVPLSSQINIDLSGNEISSISSSICSKPNWNNGDLEKFGCNGLLCPLGYFSSSGRQSSVERCSPCTSASYYGTSECLNANSSRHSAAFSLIFSLGVIFLIGLIYVLYVKRKNSHANFDPEDIGALECEAIIT